MNAARRRAAVRVIIVACGVSTLSSCASLFPPAIETRKEVLSKLPLEIPQQPTGPATLLVFPPETRPLYDTTRMAYTTRPYEIAYFSQHEWGETPSQMLQPLLLRTLQNTRHFRAVLTPPYSGRYTYALRTEILELTQDFTSEPPIVRLSMRLALSNAIANRIIATKEISLREPMREKTPYAGVVSANEVTAKALRQVAEFVLEKTN